MIGGDASNWNPLAPSGNGGGMNSLASNPLFLAGLQMLNNNQRGPQYRPMFQGVGQAIGQANQNAYLQQQQAQQQEEAAREAEDRMREEADRKKIDDFMGKVQGNPLNPAEMPGALMSSGVPDLFMKGAEMSMKPAARQRLTQVMGPGGPILVPEDQAAGMQPVLANQMPFSEEQMAQKKELAGLRGGGASPYSVPIQTDQGLFWGGTRDQSLTPMMAGGQQLRGAQYDPGTQGAVANAKGFGSTTGKATGAATSDLADAEAALPNLEQVVTELSEIGKKATYTKVGQFRDAAQRQMGMDVGEGAIARAEYISKIDNEVLPLLRQTFGAAFTQKEGESLKVTLGDPDKSPAEKNAVLKSFIASKKAQIASGKRRVGVGASGSWDGKQERRAAPSGGVFDAADAILNGQ